MFHVKEYHLNIMSDFFTDRTVSNNLKFGAEQKVDYKNNLYITNAFF